MAPQNSTLLTEHSQSADISHYSPILKAFHDAIETCSSSTDTDEYERRKSIDFDREDYEQVENEIPIWICGKPRFISGITNNTTCSDLIQALIDDELNSSSVDVTASRDLNDYVITEKWRDVEQALPGDTKILPIWKAWGGVQYEVKFKLKINKNKAGTQIAGDYSNDNGYANHYDKRHKQDEENEKSKAVKQLMKRLMYQGESIKQQLDRMRQSNGSDKNRLTSKTSNKYPRSLLNSFLHDTLHLESFNFIDDDCADKKMFAKISPMEQQPRELATSPMSNDELFLIMDDGTGHINDETDSSVQVEYRQYYLNKKLDLAIAASKVSVSSTSAAPKQKSIPRKLEFEALRQNCLNKRLIKHLCENINQKQMRRASKKDNTFQHEIEKRLAELQRLSAHEEQLMKQLCAKCERYRNQNNKYMTKQRVKLCIDEVQHNLDVYAKEIIENELELHQVQTEIQQKYDTLTKLTKKVDHLAESTYDSDNTINNTLSIDKSLII